LSLSVSSSKGLDEKGGAMVNGLLRINANRFLAIQRRQQPLEVRDLLQGVDHDVGVRRIVKQEVLVVVLGPIEHRELVDARDDRLREQVGLVELRDVRL